MAELARRPSPVQSSETWRRRPWRSKWQTCPDEVLKSVESGQRAVIDAVRKFVGAVDESMPAHGDDHPSRRNTIVDAALDMADKLVKTQYEFIRSVVSNASETLKKQGDAKPPTKPAAD